MHPNVLTKTHIIDLLEAEELRPYSTTLYRVAAEEILKIGQMLPAKMCANYKHRDMNEYLRLMTKYGEIEEAVDVACDILDRACKMLHVHGTGDYFSDDKATHQNHLPVLIIEKLNYFTKLNHTDLQLRLNAKMEDYLEMLKRISRVNLQNTHVSSIY